MQLHAFVTLNSRQIIHLFHEKAIRRFEPLEVVAVASSNGGVPQFLDQAVDTLKGEQNSEQRATDVALPAPTDIERAAAVYGAELLRCGFGVDQVVYEYGDVCHCATALAVEQNVVISTDEFQTLNRCLDDACSRGI